MFGNQLTAEGLPLSRKERGVDDYEDILAGNDFLSVFLESTLNRLKEETTIVPQEILDITEEMISTEPYLRETRAANYFNDIITTDRPNVNSSDGVIIAVHVSSSVNGYTNYDSKHSKSQVVEQNYLASEEPPSILANSGKSQLNVEEPQPITKDAISDSTVDYNRLKANVQNLPSSQHIQYNPNNKETPPFHHSLIYHDNPSQPGRARSVSYSTIIQDIQQQANDKVEPFDRKERNYPTDSFHSNSFQLNPSKDQEDPFKSSTTINYDASSTVRSETTPKKSFQQQIYGKPEQNYEIDEALSVVTNGRTHGIQQRPQTINKAKSEADKDQKVGYVVEGRNYRKYRVEERTPDGFIVGEYGVVSHDDGSLRGVRYTADGTINPRLIYDTLMKFLAL